MTLGVTSVRRPSRSPALNASMMPLTTVVPVCSAIGYLLALGHSGCSACRAPEAIGEVAASSVVATTVSAYRRGRTPPGDIGTVTGRDLRTVPGAPAGSGEGGT